VNNNPNDGEATFQLATIYAGASREEDMKGVLRRILENPAAFPHAHLKVGEFYERNRRWNDAIQEYEQGEQASPKEKIVYLKRITNVWLAQGKGELASRAVSEIRKQAPSDEEAQAVQASLLLAVGKPEKVKEAASLFQGLVKKNSENAVWHFNLGRALAAREIRWGRSANSRTPPKEDPTLFRPGWR
jgi:predicted Zn-dependent protease